ncbi:MAG: hypothetical protein KDI61_10330 [Alphaproteobacteria bacterium]|nr:hypothetical protein [Alphaproteobacteria bacterium]
MTDKFFEKMIEISEAVSQASPEIKDHILYIGRIWENVLKNARTTEARLLGQYVEDYDPAGSTPLNQMVQGTRTKLESLMMWTLSSCVLNDEQGNFPQNFLEEVRDIVSEENEEVLTPEMIEHIRAFNNPATPKKDHRIDEGVSVLEEQLNFLIIRDFSRRLEESYNKPPSLALVPV